MEEFEFFKDNTAGQIEELENWHKDLTLWAWETPVPQSMKSAMMRCFCIYLADSLRSYILLDRSGYISQACAVARCQIEAAISGSYLLHCADDEIDRYSEFANYSQAKTVLQYKSTLGTDMIAPPGWIEDLKKDQATGRNPPYNFTAATMSGIRLDLASQAKFLDTHCLIHRHIDANWWSRMYRLSVKHLHSFAHPSALAVLYLKGSEDLILVTRRNALGSMTMSTRSFLDVVKKTMGNMSRPTYQTDDYKSHSQVR